jgi:predicted tellurium resistance membrane protein TerC
MAVIISRLRRRLGTIYANLTTEEISGSLGDLGTLLPLLVALSAQRSIALAPSLFFGGLSNLISGLIWDVPMCVQPMKSIAAVALSESWEEGRVTAAGIWVGLLVLILGATSLIEIVNKIVPGNVVSGLQIGVGIRLASKGMQMVGELGWLDGYDCILLGVLCALLCMYWLGERGTIRKDSNRSHEDRRQELNLDLRPSQDRSILERMRSKCGSGDNRKHPVGVYLFLIGAIFATITLATAKKDGDKYDLPLRFFGAPIAIWAVDDISADDWKYGFLEGAIPQLPLTTLNSVISVCALAHSLYPEKRKSGAEINSTDAVISRKEVAISVGLMNLLFCPFGSMPNCHGAGGLAGQHRLGARHGSSVVFLGVAKMMLAIFFGASALTLLDAFPNAVLGVMLAITGQELATTGFIFLVRSVEEEASKVKDVLSDSDYKKEKSRILRQSTVISVITAMVIISLGKTHYGALCGFIAHMVYGDGTLEFKIWYRSRKEPQSIPLVTDHGSDEVDESSSMESP